VECVGGGGDKVEKGKKRRKRKEEEEEEREERMREKKKKKKIYRERDLPVWRLCYMKKGEIQRKYRVLYLIKAGWWRWVIGNNL